MAILSADDILNADDLKSEPVEVPEWGGTVLVQGMSGTARDRFEAAMMKDNMSGVSKDKALDNYRARLAAACIVGEDGKRLFQGDAVVRRLGEKSAQALTRVAEVASRLSGLTDADVQELTGN
ncbi:hypothetical protein [Streptomyces viridochromogenes]|uniref:hypothetical protein n=1 Tax=Streptomyces viridochromogenes TaxID=1938 RepID=UPI00069D139E|nr:hypothetical protein [Streptomyces viridochromogenes]KOG22002.1 hypothetical protein ADK36_13765 [Streptomyces viridochromogenes]